MALEIPNLAVTVDPVSQVVTGADDPLWYKDAVLYQIHVKSFFDSNNDGVGDFQGLTQKLDYLQDLGVTCLWLLPFCPSPLRDDGYDISDYLNVHPSYGTLNDFQAFVRAAHARNLRVLIELVVNHTSDQHPWFQRARHAPRDSPEREFYVWSDSDKKFPETRIIFLDTEKSNWAYDPVAGQYYWHRFFSHQPDLNHNNPAVVDAVIDVMKFWLNFGVDALRLDAVPYLCVREGTNNENLPETHSVLRRMRRELDAAFKNRMLLAEANQWPSDVRMYFGDGDECHMAFHFPLMPRMFMAIRQEDRHAVTEILSQTPEIPDNCQWALFLRNHDELTLEMVTDEERDYMYSVYAADPQMRLNVGIRRRLAPLMENSRRRVELMHAMLFSFPGTPIIYYGDEIGMGDNIYLGDRNGVRTPMQWSSDRNGGFSRADPARLYAPPIQDPVYGYQSINVEAQERYPFSLLNWMKRLIAMRRQHRVFGRGSLEFVPCSNRKALAYLRGDERETILCVVNLSRSVQPAELDLKEFAGRIPVEMLGLTEFPRITDRPYFLTLGPYASYWFALQREPMQMAARVTAAQDPHAEIIESLPALMMGVEWQNALDSGSRMVLERQALRPFLERQRWFASKSREIKQARFTDWTAIRLGRHPAFLTIVSIEYTDGWTESYFVPLAFVADDDGERAVKTSPVSVLARVTGARKGAIVDGIYDDDLWGRLLELIEKGQELATSRGSVHGLMEARPLDLDSERRWTRGSGDQSNSLAFVNDRYVLKLFRRMAPTPNPEYEISSVLTRRGFTRTPALAGALQYLRPNLEPGTLGVLQAAVKHQGSGWEFTVDELRRFYERVSARVRETHAGHVPDPGASAYPVPLDHPVGHPTGPASAAYPAHGSLTEPPPLFAALENWYLTSAATLGRRTAELHLILADTPGPEFSSEPLDAAALEALANDMRAHAVTMLELLERRIGTLNETSRPHAEAVLANRAALLSRFDDLRGLDYAGSRIRIHGDYHLGQVLRTEEDFVILDFEGEPDRSIAYRRAKQSPLKDVAGMIRSYSYAAYAALVAFTIHTPDSNAVLEPWADTWQYWVSDAFLNGYRSMVGDSSLVPRGERWDRLLRAFVIEKALYELGYEVNHRPDWVRIPLIGIRKLVSSVGD
jgi:maltose alpha-D-glucosyltransferase / alpha-amylase